MAEAYDEVTLDECDHIKNEAAMPEVAVQIGRNHLIQLCRGCWQRIQGVVLSEVMENGIAKGMKERRADG